MIHGMQWYLVAVRAIREAFEYRRIGYTEAVWAVEEIGRLIACDAELVKEWGVL